MFIQHRARAKQIRDFSGMEYGTIKPTDIDGLIEYHGLGYVLFEIKFRDAQIPNGQRLAMQRSIDDWTRAQKPAIGIIASHQVDNPEDDIIVADTLVSEFRWAGQWRIPQSECTTTKEMVDWFINEYCKGKKL